MSDNEQPARERNPLSLPDAPDSTRYHGMNDNGTDIISHWYRCTPPPDVLADQARAREQMIRNWTRDHERAMARERERLAREQEHE